MRESFRLQFQDYFPYPEGSGAGTLLIAVNFIGKFEDLDYAKTYQSFKQILNKLASEVDMQ